jgi:hypothetical protein
MKTLEERRSVGYGFWGGFSPVFVCLESITFCLGRGLVLNRYVLGWGLTEMEEWNSGQRI